MRKMGHKTGQGLGKDNSGIIHAFSAEHVNPTSSKSNKKWVQASSSKGRLVNMNEDTKLRAERERYGEPSSVICLVNVVGDVGEVDDELSAEIGEECAKNG